MGGGGASSQLLFAVLDSPCGRPLRFHACTCAWTEPSGGQARLVRGGGIAPAAVALRGKGGGGFEPP